MMYHAPTGRMVVDLNALKGATLHLRYAMKKIREQAGIPLEPYAKEPGRLSDADMAQMALIEVAEAFGIDMGVPRQQFHKLDLRDVG